MALDPSFVGRSYPPTSPYEVGREKIREFAAAVGDLQPAYLDADAAKALGHPDVIAPPTFPIVISMLASDQAMRDPELGIDYGRVVHGEQRFAYARPVVAGDVLTVTLTIEDIRSAAGNDLLGTRSEITTVEGEHVCTAWGVIVSRGTAA